MEKTKKKADIPEEVKKYIEASVKMATESVQKACKSVQTQNAKMAFKNTEARLYALPVLKVKISDDKESVQDLKTYGTPARSKSITRFTKNTIRLDPDEALEAIIEDKEASIEADQHEVDELEKALDYIRTDQYYETVAGRYFEGLDNEEIAERIGCDTTTVWRNRKRLIKTLSIRLYGTEAID